DVAAILGPWLHSKPVQQRLWPGRWVNHAAKMVKGDLGSARAGWLSRAANAQEQQEREGSTYLVFQDNAGRVFDFHALRHQYVSNLAAAGVHPKIAQTLARHSTITLTLDRYTHVGLHDLAASVNSLPAIPHVETNALKATGTAGAEVPTVVTSSAENGAVL